MATSRKRQSRPSPLRAALAAKTSLRTFHDIAVADQDQVAAVERDLAAARQLHAATLLHEDPAVRERVQVVQEDALKARAACFHRIYFRGLGWDEFDALVALHPPTAEEAADGRSWHADTFEVALVAETAEDADGEPAGLTAEEWAEEFADSRKWPAPDRRKMIRQALNAQQQTLSDAVPKG